MKNTLILFSFMLILVSCGKKEVKKEIVPQKKVEKITTPQIKKEKPKPTLVFTVQIGANTKESKVFSSVENVKVYKEEGMFKYRLGDFKTYKEAKLFRKQILNKYPGSFVQAVKGDLSISIEEAIK